MRGRPNIGKRFAFIRKQYGDQVAWWVLLVRDRHLGHEVQWRLDDQAVEVLDNLTSFGDDRTRDEKYLQWAARLLHRSRKRHGDAAWQTASRLNLSWWPIVDWAKAERINLMTLNLMQAESGSRRWHQGLRAAEEIAEANRPRRLEPDDVGDVLMRWPDGYTMQRLRLGQLKEEGRVMGHCVGRAGYQQEISRGRIWILSLRDAQNQPHITLEIQRSPLRVNQAKGKENKLPVKKHRPRLRRFMLEHIGENLDQWGEAIIAAPPRLVSAKLSKGEPIVVNVRTWQARLSPNGEADVFVPASARSWAEGMYSLGDLVSEIAYNGRGSLRDVRLVRNLAINQFLFDRDEIGWGFAQETQPFDPSAPEDGLQWAIERTDELESEWQEKFEGFMADEDHEEDRIAVFDDVYDAVYYAINELYYAGLINEPKA